MTDEPHIVPRRRHWFKVGVLLLVLNVPFGYGGVAACTAFALARKQSCWCWLLLGGGMYGLSWLMLGVGLLLTGAEGIDYIKGLRGRHIRRRRERKASESE